MTYEGEPWFETVVAIAARAHADQVDKCGEPYIEHLVRTAGHLVKLFPDASRAEIEAAVIHDIFEDTETTAEELAEEGVDFEAIAIARELSKPRDADYKAWIYALMVKGSTSALRVKLADNADNSDMRRVLKANSLDLLALKYRPAKAILEGEIRRRAAAAGLPVPVFEAA